MGILPLNENKSSEMVDIMSHLHQYVPMSQSHQDVAIPGTSQTVTVAKASVHQILIGGDQLTAVRARSALKAKANEDTPSLRLEGFVPVIEDWHVIHFIKNLTYRLYGNTSTP